MTSAQSTRILDRARQAQPGWAALSVSQRCKYLGQLRRAIAADCESIANTIAGETSKPLLDALSGDVMVTLEMMRYYESRAAKILRARRIGKPAFFFRRTRFEVRYEPHGVALIIGPSNYPFQLSMVPLITALAAGNAVVLKVSERTPATAALIARLCAEAELPDSLVQTVDGGPADSIALIDSHPDIVFFTGSSRNGQMVAERAAQHLIPAILELGGKDAALVFADCNLARAVEGIAYGAFANAGRVCVGIKRIFIQECIYEEFMHRLRERLARLTVKPSLHADLCPLPEQDSRLLRAQIEDALARGATLRWPSDRSSLGRTPVLLSDVPPQSRLLTEESFGPVLCLVPFRDEAEALAAANESEFALSSSVWTSNMRRARRVAAALSAPSCAVNDVIRIIANPHAPFGGNGLSGYGRYHGPEGLHAFSRSKTLMIAAGRRSREINWFPFSARTCQQLAGLLRLRHGGLQSIARMARILLALMACCLTAGAQQPARTHVDLDIRLAPHAHGELAYLVFSSSKGFPNDTRSAVRGDFLPIPPGAARMHVDMDLPPGTYAVSVFEDLNGNHKLDRNLLGIPREPVGASNNPRPRMGPPRFDECSLHVAEKTETMTIYLVSGL